MAFFDRLKNALTSKKEKAAEDIHSDASGNEPDYSVPLQEKRYVAAENVKQEMIEMLTPREYDVYLQLLEGYTLKESAKRLSIKYSTANTHMSGIYRKLQVKSRAELIINYRNVTVSNGKGP